MKVTASAVTGRRFPRDAHTDRLIAFEQDAVAAPGPPARRSSRGDRPAPIPHFEPITGTTPILPDTKGPD